MTTFLVKAWRLIQGPLQWYVLWLAHHKFMIGVSGVVTNDRNEVLLLRHRYWKEGSWGLPSGYANRGETLEQSVAREIFEETGLRAEISELVSMKSGFKLRLDVTYRGRITGGNLRLDKKEVIEAAYFGTENLPEGLLAAHRELIGRALQPDLFPGKSGNAC